MRSVIWTVVVIALMVACGLASFMGSVWFLMWLGLRQHDNYEYYGQTPAAILIFVATAAGFVAPAIAGRYLYNRSDTTRPTQFSVRALLIAVTLLAIVMGTAAYLRLW